MKRSFHNQQELRIVVPQLTRRIILASLHDLRGHLGFRKTYGIINKYFYWENLRDDDRNPIKDCVLCMKTKSDINLVRNSVLSVPVNKAGDLL